MRKLSIFILIVLSTILTSCFNKEEKNPTSVVPKTEINNAILPVENNSWITNIVETTNEVSNTWIIENKTTNPTFELISSSWTIEKLKKKIKITGVVNNNEIKLIDAYLSDETEELSEKEKNDLKSYIPEMDNKTLVKIKNSRFYKDKNDIYIELYWVHKLWINPNNFKTIQPDWDYRTDWKNYYLLNNRKIDLDINTLKSAYIINSIASFYILGDLDNLYLWSKFFKWWDINSIQYIPWSDCLKDKTYVYCYSPFQWGTLKKGDIYIKIEWADINSFTVINDIPQDKKCTYKIEWTEATCTPKETKSSSKNSEIKLIDAYLSDETEEVSEEEKKSFIESIRRNDVIVDKESLVKIKYSWFYKDKKDVYWCTFIGCYSMWKNPENIKVVKQYWSIWTDWKDLYWFSPKVNNFDLDSLKYTKLNWLDILWDKYNLYFWWKSYKWWDINSLVSISKNCLKDKNNIYCSWEIILDAPAWYNYKIVESVDKDTFQEINIDFYKDKNNIYKYQYKEDKYGIIFWIQDINSFTVIDDIPQDNKCTYKIEWNTATCTPK